MRAPLSTALCLALSLSPLAASAQVAANFASRTGSPRGATTLSQRINAVDCRADEQWTFTVELPQPTAAAPELWVSTRRGCDVAAREPSPDATCFNVCSATSRRACSVPYGQGAQRYTFTVPARWLVDPVTGACTPDAGRAYLNVIAGGAIIATSPTVIRWDNAAPVAPGGLTASLGGSELTAVLSWSYTTVDDTVPPTDAGFDLGVDTGADDVVDASLTDVADAGPDVVDAGFDAGADAGSATPASETIARFRVLCDPPLSVTAPTTSDGGSCGTGAFASLDVNDEASIARYECAPEVAPETRTLTLTGLRAGVSYSFAVLAEDLAGNRSALTVGGGCVEGRAVTDFWERYHQQGGAGQPGLCDARPWSRSGGGGALAALALALGAAVTRRRFRDSVSRRR